jgi:hypothetical protein
MYHGSCENRNHAVLYKCVSRLILNLMILDAFSHNIKNTVQQKKKDNATETQQIKKKLNVT